MRGAFFLPCASMKRFTFYFTLILALFIGASFSCKKKKTPPNPTASFYAKGADIGWLTEMESQGKKFYDATGQEKDCIQLLKDLGINSIRLRVWVNPTNGWNNASDVLAKAIRAKAKGMKLMLDFHYSDTWADPSQQTIPTAWTNYDLATMKTAVYNHTFNVLTTLKQNGITPTWVQVGNEVDNGMLWPMGKASISMSNFASLEASGYDAVKAIDNSIQVIVHVSNGFDNSLFRWIFDGLKNNGGKWDIIGMSLYPPYNDWQTRTEQCLANMNDMVGRYGKPIIITEVGMSWDQPDASQLFLKDIIAKNKSLGTNYGLGVFYWEPECNSNWNGYTLGAFDNSGKPTSAMSAFAN